jgi:hypothetical protein
LPANPIQRPPMTQQSNPMTPDWIGLVGGHPAGVADVVYFTCQRHV